MPDISGEHSLQTLSSSKTHLCRRPTSYKGNFFHIWRRWGLPNTCAPNNVSQPFRVEKKSRIVTFWKCRTGKPKGRPRQISRVILPGWNHFQSFILTMYGAEILHHGVGRLFVYSMPICWIVPPPRMPVITRIITFLVGDPNLNLHLPPLLAGGTTQPI